MDGTRVTVLLATRNRAGHIRGSLSSIVAAREQTAFNTEILVVDNASSDETATVLNSIAKTVPYLRVIQDLIPGKSGAINRALDEARGSTLIFTDDDVHVPPTWINDMAGPIEAGNADAVAGRLILAGDIDRPWLTQSLRAALAELLDISGDSPGMVGANMATSKAAALAIKFDEGLGPGARGFADDVLFSYRLRAAGYRIVGSSGPPAEHHLAVDRLSYLSMRDLAERNGESHAYLTRHFLGETGHHLLLKIAFFRLKLIFYRIGHRARSDFIAEREFKIRERLSFYSGLRRERQVPRIYVPD